MEKKEAFDEFIRHLQISFNIASLYSKDHPQFFKPIEELKNRAEALLGFQENIRIDATADSIFIDGQKLSRSGWPEIAAMLHRRKIKTVIIKNGITQEELVSFLSSISLRPHEILIAGGINKILGVRNRPALEIDELDYSHLLRGEGEEIKDVWTYLLRDAVRDKDGGKISELTGSFKKVVNKFRLNDLVVDEEAQKNIASFLEYLKTNQKDKLVSCTQEILKSVIKEKDIPEVKKFEKILVFLNDLSGNELASALYESVSEAGDYDALNLKLFYKLLDERKHKEVAVSFSDKLQKTGHLKHNSQAKKKIQDLFSISDGSSVSEIYRSTLSNLLKNVAFESVVSFDRKLLQSNYRFILLDLLDIAESEEKLRFIDEKIIEELKNVFESQDWEYIKYLFEELKSKEGSSGIFKDVLKNIFEQITSFVEMSAWNKELPFEFRYLAQELEKSVLGRDFYLSRIFEDNTVTGNSLELFLKFFPADIDDLCARIEARRSDLDFQAKLVEALKDVDCDKSSRIFKRMFSFSNEVLKEEIMKALRTLPSLDEDFLMSILKNEPVMFRKEALSIAVNNEAFKKKAFEALLLIESPWGRNNAVILENLSIIEELSAKEARDYVETLSRRRFFWNWAVKRRAAGILRNWNE